MDKYKLPENIRKAVIDIVNVKMVPHPVKIKADIRLTCFTIGGVEDIKAALREGELLSQKDIPIKVRIIASPNYEVMTETVKKNDGLNLITEAVKKIELSIKAKSGNFVLITKPEILGENTKDIEEQLKDIKKTQDDEMEEDDDHEEGITAEGVEGFDD